MNDSELLNDPDFLRLLHRRSRLRWGLSGLLVSVYLAYGLVGVYSPATLGQPFFGSAVTYSVVLGYGIIFLGIACSIYYVWQVNRIIAPLQQRLARELR